MKPVNVCAPVSAAPTHHRPTWAELRDAFVEVLEHLDCCGWGDAHELRMRSEDLLRRVWNACSECGRPVRQPTDKGSARTCHDACRAKRQSRFLAEYRARKRAAKKT